MIKCYFVDDDEKLEELLTVITNAVDTTGIDELDGYEVKQYTNQELKEKLSKSEAENEELRVQKDQTDIENKKLKDYILQMRLVIPE